MITIITKCDCISPLIPSVHVLCFLCLPFHSWYALTTSYDIVYSSASQVWLEDINGNVITEVKVIANTTMNPVYCRYSSGNAVFSLDKDLPEGLQLNEKQGIIQGYTSALFPPTTYSLKAESELETATLTFTLSVTPCEYPLLFPEVVMHTYARLVLINNGYVYFNQTFSRTTAKDYAICAPPMRYDYSLSCTSFMYTCYFYIRDSQDWILMSTSSASQHTVQGVMEMTATGKPTVSLPSLVTVATGEKFSLMVSVQGVRGEISISPPLSASLSLDGKAGFISGIINEPMTQSYTVTAKSSFGDVTTQFTLAVGQCPQGLQRLIIRRGDSSREFWRVFDAQNNLLFDQVASCDSDFHGVCWTPGSYRFELTSTWIEGWQLNSRVDVEDETGVLAEFRLPMNATDGFHQFTWEYSIPLQSEWKMQRGSVDSKWTRVKFNDKKWESGRDGAWGSFSKDVSSIFLRRSFSVDASKFTFIHISIKRSSECEVVAYLNEREVVHLSGNASIPFTRLTFPIAKISSNSVLAVEVRRAATAETAPIVFDAVVAAVSSGPIIQSVDGVASDNQQGKQSSPKSAFDMNRGTYWSATTFPAILKYTFSKSRVVMNRAVIYDVHSGSFDSIRVEGVDGNSTVVLYSVTDSHLMRNGIKVMEFDHDRAFSSYQLVFGASDMISISDVRFFSVSGRQCKKRWRYPMTRPGETRYGKCPLFTVGVNQMHCVEGDTSAEWEEDRSVCMSRLPSQQWSFVDWSFELTNVTTIEWNKSVRSAVIQVMMTNMKIKEEEVGFLLVRDMTDTELKLNVLSRMTLEAEIGDYILKHFKLFEPDFNNELKKVHKDVSIQILDMKLREPIAVTSIVQVCVVIVIVLVIMVLEYLICIRVKTPRTKSLKHLREKEGLLSESVYCVCWMMIFE